ncbi:MAG: metal-dependent hydrolase [Clostridia bacterium]|nr:metal-dependent hydrolase [Clostridia bacterium]
MTAKGHVLLSSSLTLGGVLIANHLGYSLPSSPMVLLTLGVGIMFGTLLPDIDEDNSYIGQKFKMFSVVFSAFVKHRTFTHYLLLPLVLFTFAFFMMEQSSLSQLLIYAIAFGMINHDIGDMLTNGGIKGFFFPLFPNTRIAILPSFLRFDTFSLVEHFFIIFFLIPINSYFVFLLLKAYGVVA